MDPISYGVAAKQKQRIEKVIAEPDSTSGVITVPQVIAAGETITVPAGRVAVLPNVQVDGTLNVEGEVFIPSGASFSKTAEVVKTIAVLKTITGTNAEVLGYHTAGDGGGGLFYWDSASTEADNGGTIIQATGLTTGRWKRVYSGAVNVKWFGAVGDGITDDTVAIQNAIDTSNIYIPKASGYLISSTINVTHNIKSDSKTPIIQSTTSDMFNVLSSVIIENISLLGNYSIGSGIILSSNNITVINSKFSGFGDATLSAGCGIKSNGTTEVSNINIKSNYFTDSKGTTNSDISIGYYGSNIIIDSNIMDGINDEGISANSIGVTSNIIITNNIIKNKYRHGILAVYTGTADKDVSSIISGNIIENCGWTGIYCQGAGAGSNLTGNVIVSNNHIKYCGGADTTLSAGIYVAGLGGYLITSNSIEYSGKDYLLTNRTYQSAGIKCATSIDSCIVSNNYIVSTYGDGISFTGLVMKNIVCETNRIKNFTGYGVVTAVSTAIGGKAINISRNSIEAGVGDGTGIYSAVSGSGSYGYFVITGNSLYGNKAGTTKSGILTNTSSASQLEQLLITNNRIENFDNAIRFNSNYGHRGVGTLVKVNDNFILSNTTGLYFTATSTLWSFISGNVFSSNGANTTSDSYIVKYNSYNDNNQSFSLHYNSAPTFGAWNLGDTVYSNSPASAGFLGWVCTTSGTPGTWKTFGAITA